MKVDLTPIPEECPRELLSNDDEPLPSKRLQHLMGGLVKNRMAINGYLRNRLTSRFKDNSLTNLPNKPKTKPPVNVLEEIEFRYAFADPEEHSEPNMIDELRSSVRRLSRMHSLRPRNSTYGRSQEDYHI
jgi:hypothetical protein